MFYSKVLGTKIIEKTSICKKVLETEKNLVMSVSYTTRPKRKSEEDGKDYIFVAFAEQPYELANAR